MTRQYFRIELVYLNEMQDNCLDSQGSVIRLTYYFSPLGERCYLNHFPSRWIFPLLIVVVDQILQIFKKVWNCDVMATGLACVDVV